MFAKQGYHLLFLLGSLVVLDLPWVRDLYRGGGSFIFSTPAWFGLALGIAVAHQIYVAVCWRWELFAGGITRTFGPAGVKAYVIIFFLLFAGRFVALLGLAMADQGSISPPLWPRVILVPGLVMLAGWTMFSVKKYFGLARATGLDHFYEEYRTMPLVKQGAFKYSSNAMYNFAIPVVWAFGLWFNSGAALLAAFYSHVYIWVHYYCTELPDMKLIYEERAE